MKENFPIIHIIALPGAGKTTLGKRLSKKLNLPIFQIDTTKLNQDEVYKTVMEKLKLYRLK